MVKRTACTFLAGFLLISGLKAQTQLAAFPKDLFLSRVTIDVARNKASRIEGGDFDDKKDRISFKIKFRNGDPNRSFEGLKFELFVFGQSMVDKKAFKLFQRVAQSFSLKPLQEFTFDSPEVVSAWDNTGAIFGEKYKGWYLIVTGPGGEVLVEKSVTAFLEGTAGLDGLTEGGFYDKKLKPLVVTP